RPAASVLNDILLPQPGNEHTKVSPSRHLLPLAVRSRALELRLHNVVADQVLDDPILSRNDTADRINKLGSDLCVRAWKPLDPERRHIHVQLIALQINAEAKVQSWLCRDVSQRVHVRVRLHGDVNSEPGKAAAKLFHHSFELLSLCHESQRERLTKCA